MNDLTVYRTTAPPVIAAYKAAQQALTEYRQQIGATLVRLGVGHLAPMGTTGYAGRFAGLAPQDDIPAGWRHDIRSGCLKPSLRTRQGQAAADALDAVRYPGDPRDALPGMPSQLLVGYGRWLTCGARMLGGALYVTWSASGSELGDAADPVLWQPVKRSEYYAAVERAEEESAGGDPA